MERKIEEHIKNLEKYCEDDIDFRSQTAEEEKSDFDIFCDGHIADIKAIIQELKSTQSDLYEANHRISDLLDTIKLKEDQLEYVENEYGRTIEQKDKIIDLMLDTLIGLDSDVEIVRKMASINTKEKKEDLLKVYEKRCKNAKD